MITIEQCRAARGLLDWTQQELANACGLSKTAINNFEKGHSDIKNESLKAIRLAFESADIEFTEDGIRRKSDTARVLRGPNALSELLIDIAATIGAGEELLLFQAGPGPKAATVSAVTLTGRAVCYGDAVARISGLQCRFLPAPMDSGMTTFIYGRKIALELYKNALIVIVNSPEAEAAERSRFENLWRAAQAAAPSSSKTGTQ